MTTGYFVTGTDTGVGKTLVACALLRAISASGKKAVGMKPVASGCEQTPQGLRHGDVERLMAASSVAAARAWVNPYAFVPALAPHIAAAQAGVAIELDVILRCLRALAARCDAVVVEGIGGFRVPLGPGVDTADMAKLLGLKVVLVVGMRLGCLNHALLSAQAIENKGVPFAGWVANQIDPAMAALEDNIGALKERIAAPLLGFLPFSDRPDSFAPPLCIPGVGLPRTAGVE